MKTIKIDFVDFWPGFNKQDNLFYSLLTQSYNVEISDNPDYIFYSVFGYRHLEYKKEVIRIFYTGENITPNFSMCDYGIGFDYISFGERYLRLPIYALYRDSYRKLYDRSFVSDEELLDRGFCSFVVSNKKYSNPIREEFFSSLSKYKKVDSGGRLYNNIGGPVADKIKFISGYKFNIAFENSSMDGYTTEKIVEAFAADTVPLYWGNRLVDKEFDNKSFVNLHSFKNINEAIDYIVWLDRNDSEYLRVLKHQCLAIETSSYEEQIGKLKNFLCNIFGKDLYEAKKIPFYGYVGEINNGILKEKRIIKRLGKFAKWLD